MVDFDLISRRLVQNLLHLFFRFVPECKQLQAFKTSSDHQNSFASVTMWVMLMQQHKSPVILMFVCIYLAKEMDVTACNCTGPACLCEKMVAARLLQNKQPVN